MEASPLSVVLLLGFGLLVAFSLTLWTTLNDLAGDGRDDRREVSAAVRVESNRDRAPARSKRVEGEARRRHDGSAAIGTRDSAAIGTRDSVGPTGVAGQLPLVPPLAGTATPVRTATVAAGGRQPSSDRGGTSGTEGQARTKQELPHAAQASPAAGRPKPAGPAKDEEDAFERFLKAKDEFDIR